MDDSGTQKGVILNAGDEARAVGWDPGPDLLLPLANTPLVERILVEYAQAGIRETLISAGRDTGEIASHCGDGARWDMTLTYQGAQDQGTRDGQGARDQGAQDQGTRDGQGAIEDMNNERIREWAAFTDNAPFLVTHGPLLHESKVYGGLIQSYRENHPRGVRAGRRMEHTHGQVDGYTGIYLMTPHFYDALNDDCTGDDSPCNLFDTVLAMLAGPGESVPELELDSRPYGVRSPEAYLHSNERLLASAGEESILPEIMDDNFSSPHLVLLPPVCVDATAELERCRIGPGVCIGPGARIGHGAAIERSVIMAGADIGDGASISHAVIGRNTGVANRSVLHGRTENVRVLRSRQIPPTCVQC